MAAIVSPARGHPYVQVMYAGRRWRIRFGQDLGRRGLHSAKRHLEELVESAHAETPPHPRTQQWLDAQPAAVHQRIARAGLCESRVESRSRLLAGFLTFCLDRKRRDCRETSVQHYEKVAGNLTRYFGPSCPLDAITADDVDEFRRWLETEANRVTGGGLGRVTVNKRLKDARAFFDIAFKRRWVVENPFAHLRKLDDQAGPKERQVYVERSVVERLITESPVTEWRLLLALWRFAGLRQLEPFALRWSDVVWDQGRMVVTAPKQRTESRRKRVIPIWPEVRPHLERQFEESPVGEEWIVRTRYAYDTQPAARSTGSALRSRLERQLLRTGIPPWPRLFQNLRSSGETELARSGRFADWEIAYWWNHSERIQRQHYLTITDDAFARAQAGGQSCTSAQWATFGEARESRPPK